MRRFTALILTAVLLTSASSAARAAESHGGHAAPAAPAAEAAAPAQKGVTIEMGAANLQKGTLVQEFLPGTVVVRVGEPVTWVNNTPEPHTATIMADRKYEELTDEIAMTPSVASGGSYDGSGWFNSGIMFAGQSYTITFSKPGVYDYLCLIHPMMQGRVVVLPAEARIPAHANQTVEEAVQESLATADYLAAQASSQGVTSTMNANGSRTYEVKVVTGTETIFAFDFYPGNLRIKEGDTVRWVADTMMGGTVGINVPADFQLFGEQGPIPENMAPAGGPLFNGTGTVRSGLLEQGQSFELTFTKAGTYEVRDYLVSAFGLNASMTITVAPKDAVDVSINGKLVSGYASSGTIYVPLKAAAEALGATLTTNSQGITVVTYGSSSQARSGDATAYLNGQPLVGEFTRNGQSYVPAMAFAMILDGSAQYDGAADLLTLTIPAAK